MKVKRESLFLIGGIVWMLAGFNVARLGFISYKLVGLKLVSILLSLIIFLIFMNIFYKLNKKHEIRILSFKENRPFWNFFDKKSYIIMITMMAFGIGIRVLNLVTLHFVAFFYTGLGCALFVAGLVFIKFFIDNILESSL